MEIQELYSVKNKVALITGASSGIGRHAAITLAKQGANVILVGRKPANLSATEQACQQYGIKSLVICADVKKNDDIVKVIEHSKKHFSQVDILVNSAGIGMRVPNLEHNEQQWDDVINTNLKGTFFFSQAISKWMIETKTHGRIINISSSAAFHTTTTRAAYSASKLAVESVTRSLALSLVRHNIRVNCIAPGFFKTELTDNYLKSDLGKSEVANVPMSRAADVKELEGILLLLASNASSYMTGAVLHVDGGYAISKV